MHANVSTHIRMEGGGWKEDENKICERVSVQNKYLREKERSQKNSMSSKTKTSTDKKLYLLKSL